MNSTTNADTEALVHFSGGSDSTLCAALLAERCHRVHLLSYDRISFLGARRYTEPNYERLCKVYGRDKFVRRVVSIDRLHREICYRAYPRILFKYRLAVTALTFSKLAMHWYSALYASRHGIGIVADGSVPYMELYPDQNQKIALRWLKPFYRELGIDYQNPVFAMPDAVEQMLYDKGITEAPLVRGTARDMQVFYLEQVILALFLKYYLATHGMEGYAKVMSELFEDRIGHMAESLREWRRDPEGSFLGRILRKTAEST